jgi:hypothetical protein
MIIESAFLKLPELLVSNFDHDATFEATVVHLFATTVHMELNSRNIPRSFEHVYSEKPYPTRADNGRAIRADLFVNLNGAVLIGGRMAMYGVRELNWVEAKVGIGSRSQSTPAKTANTGKIVRDLLRLCLLPNELQGSIRQNARYMLMVFDNHPSAYLPLTSAVMNRVWLSDLFSEGDKNIEINLADESDTLRTAIGPGFTQLSDLQANLKLNILSFKPLDISTTPLYWGYLLRIQDFQITVSGLRAVYEDKLDASFDEKQLAELNRVRVDILRKMGKQMESLSEQVEL